LPQKIKNSHPEQSVPSKINFVRLNEIQPLFKYKINEIIQNDKMHVHRLRRRLRR